MYLSELADLLHEADYWAGGCTITFHGVTIPDRKRVKIHGAVTYGFGEKMIYFIGADGLKKAITRVIKMHKRTILSANKEKKNDRRRSVR